MSDNPENIPSRNLGLMGTLKIAAAITVILIACLSILLVTDTISREVFNEYLMTLLTVVIIATIAGAIIALMIRPGK